MDKKMDKQIEILEEMNRKLTDFGEMLNEIKFNTGYPDTHNNDDVVHELCNIKGLIKKFTEKPEIPTMAEYVWIHPNSKKFCSKIKTIATSENKDEAMNLPKETIYIRCGEEEESYELCPIAKFNDPFQRENYVLVFCEIYDESTYTTAARTRCEKINDKLENYSFCSFEIEQEFYFDEFNNRKNELPLCIAHSNLGRKILETHYRACLSANIPISSATYIDRNEINYYSYKIGPSDMLQVSDYLWLSRYILQRISEESNLTVKFSYHDNPLHYFYPSTHYYYNLSGRYSGSYHSYDGKNDTDNAKQYLKNMEMKHDDDIKSYDCQNGDKIKKIMLEKMKSSKFTEHCVKIIDCGGNQYIIRDSRPAGDSDPYIVTSTIVTTCHKNLRCLQGI